MRGLRGDLMMLASAGYLGRLLVFSNRPSSIYAGKDESSPSTEEMSSEAATAENR